MFPRPRTARRGPRPRPGNAQSRMGRPYSKRPGKFLISVPGHDTPKQARAYLLTDQAVADTTAHHANSHPSLDPGITRCHHRRRRNPRQHGREPGPRYSAGRDRLFRRCQRRAYRRRGTVAGAVHRPGRGDRRRRAASPDRDEPPDPLPAPGRPRQSRRAVQVSRGRWRRHHRDAATVSDRLTVCLISRLARVSARKCAYTPAETNAETITGRHP